MTQGDREVLNELTDVVGRLDADGKNQDTINGIKLQLKALELIARIDAKMTGQAKRTPWVKKLQALQPLITLITLITLLIINLLGIELDVAKIMP
ncbi:MAG: hypothetical protein AAF267_01450 [Deinococcota bacterium]